MGVESHQNLHNEQMSDCPSFGSQFRPSSQSRKISIGIMADSAANTRYGSLKGDGIIMPNTERVIPNFGDFVGEKNKVEAVKASFNMNQAGGPAELKCSQISKHCYQRSPTSETIVQANHVSKILLSSGRQDNHNGVECAPEKYSVQLFSNQTSIFHSNNYNQKRVDEKTSNKIGRKGGVTERVEEFTFGTAQEVFKSDKAKVEDKTSKIENRTDNLRLKLCEILGTTSSPKAQHSGSLTPKKNVESMLPEQHFDQNEDKFVETRQNSDTIEADSENPDRTDKRPVTRSWSRRRASAKKQPTKCKSNTSLKDKDKHQDNNIFSFEERRTVGNSAFPDGNSSMSLRKKSQRKMSRDGPSKVCCPENDTVEKCRQETSKTDIYLHDGETFSLGNKMRGFYGWSPDHQKERPRREDVVQEVYQSPIIDKDDQLGELEGLANGNCQEDRNSPQDNFQSPTFAFKTPTLSTSTSSTPKTNQMANGDGSPASTKRRFSLGAIHLRTFQNLEPDCNRQRAERQSSDMGAIKDSLSRKATSFVKQKDMQDGLSDSLSEEGSSQESQEGIKERHSVQEQTFVLHPIKRLCSHEGIKFNESSPVSPSSKGTGGNDWIAEASTQNQEDGFGMAVDLFALELGKLKSRIKSMTSQKSSEVLMCVAEEIHLQLQNVHSQIQKDLGKLTNVSKSKRKRLETKFEDHQRQLRLIHEKFKEEVNLHLQDCRNFVEGFEADQKEIKGALEKQRASHRKLLSQVEEAMDIKLNDAERKITAIQELARGKLLQLKQVVALCLKEGILN